MKKVISLPSSPALRRFSPSSSHSPSSSSTRSSSSTPNNKTTSPALRRPSPNSHHKPNYKKNANNNKKKLSLSIKLAASSDSEWGRTDDEGDDDDSTTTWGSSDEDEWESSFDPSWVVDADELELHRRWTDQNGITTAGQPAGVIKGKPLRRSPLATNSTVSASLSPPASCDHPSMAQHAGVGTGACADVSTSRPPSPSTSATATGHQISYAQLQSAANAASSAAARHSPSSSPRQPVDLPAGSLLPALDLDRVVSSPVSLGSSMSRRNTIATPREARGDGASSSAAAVGVVSQWKVGRISPRSDGDVKSEATAAEKSESEEETTAKLSPRRSELQISFERFEARLALKKQQQQQAGEPQVIGAKAVEQPQPPGKTVTNGKRSGSKRKMKKNVRSLNKEETDAKRKKKRNEAETRRTYRRSQGSPPMLLRSASAAAPVESDSDSSEVAGYLAECGGSETETEKEEKRAKASSAPVSPHSSSSSSSTMSLAVIASLALRSGGFPLSRSRSSEMQAKARRTITKEDKKRDDANNVAGGAISTDHHPAVVTVTAAPLPPNHHHQHHNHNNNHDSSVMTQRGDDAVKPSQRNDNAELTWKTIWQDPHEGETEGAVTLTSSPSSALTSSLSANEASTRKVLKRGLEGRSASLPPAPSRPQLAPLPPPSSPSLPPHIEPLPFPPFATSPPASLKPFASPPAAPSSVAASVAASVVSLRHRRRAESSGAPQQLLLVAPPLSPHVYQKPRQQHHLHHPHRSLERVRTVVMSPSLAARQQQRQASPGVASLGSSRAAAESGEINTSSFLRSQSEEISARAFDDEFDHDDGDDDEVDDNGIHERRRVALTSWRGRSGDEWRNRSREFHHHHPSEDLATRRARIERARSFGARAEPYDNDNDSGDDDDLLFVSDDDDDDDDDSVFVEDNVDDEHMIEAELTSFLKRTRSGSHKPLRDFGGEPGRRSPLTVRLLPHHHNHHHASMTPMTPMGDELTIGGDGGLESGESHTAGGARDSGHELPCRSPWGTALE